MCGSRWHGGNLNDRAATRVIGTGALALVHLEPLAEELGPSFLSDSQVGGSLVHTHISRKFILQNMSIDR